MHRAALVAPVLLGACAAAGPRVHGESPRHTCDAEAAQQFLGRAGSNETGTAILNVTHSAVLRWAPPGVMLTMDYRADRVTVRLAPDGKITAINCG